MTGTQTFGMPSPSTTVPIRTTCFFIFIPPLLTDFSFIVANFTCLDKKTGNRYNKCIADMVEWQTPGT